jgi:hypothetical protein
VIKKVPVLKKNRAMFRDHVPAEVYIPYIRRSLISARWSFNVIEKPQNNTLISTAIPTFASRIPTAIPSLLPLVKDLLAGDGYMPVSVVALVIIPTTMLM